jgi:hypothetical protein
LLNRKLIKNTIINQERPYESFGAISSEGVIPWYEKDFISLQQFLPHLWKLATSNQTRNAILRCVARLYLGAPLFFKEYVRECLCKDPESIKRDVLTCTGRIFENSKDIQAFYAAFERKALSSFEKPLNWIYCIRNIIRYRSNALDTLTIDTKTLNVFTEYLCNILEIQYKKKACNSIALACITTISALLYRRKFENHFLTYDTKGFLLIQECLKKIRKIASKKHCNIIDSTLRFLRLEATESDALPFYNEVDEESD